MTQLQMEAPVKTPCDVVGNKASVSNAWLRALELTAPISRNPGRLLSTVVEELAAELGNKPALLSDRESLTYSELAARSNQYARWALTQGIEKGEVVGLLMTNRPEYIAIWLGITSVGGVVALLNTNLAGASLAHCIGVVSPSHLIVASEFFDRLPAVVAEIAGKPTIWTHGVGNSCYPSIDLDMERYSGKALDADERRAVTIEDRALYIYTSGTTGLPKAANISHARVMQWSHWFAGMMNAGPSDRMYNCLPMYHSVGGVQTPGATLVAGGTLVIREKFSARQFWSDIVRWDCTLLQYIGELCRYLLHTPPSPPELEHRIRMACGNGLAPEVWDGFKERFQIPQILEFYASTEGGVSLFNVQGQRGAIGHIPGYLAHRFAPALVRFDVETGQPVRDDNGFCLRCRTNEIGEAIGKVVKDPSNIGSRFEGYTTPEATGKKILHNVFHPGDRWIRTGDLMRKDDKGFFYFVDRVGDTFRWKGENVATSEVAEALCEFAGIRHANVYGVAIPGTEGKAGMATLAIDEELDLVSFRRHLANRLPHYARPLFFRLRNEVELTGTFKYSKTELLRDGYDPAMIRDEIYFNSPEVEALIPLNAELYQRILLGQVRL